MSLKSFPYFSRASSKRLASLADHSSISSLQRTGPEEGTSRLIASDILYPWLCSVSIAWNWKQTIITPPFRSNLSYLSCPQTRKSLDYFLGSAPGSEISMPQPLGGYEKGVVKRDRTDQFYVRTRSRFTRPLRADINKSKFVVNTYQCNISRSCSGAHVQTGLFYWTRTV